jgi:TatA/E family protein of Tat protein translocase
MMTSCVPLGFFAGTPGPMELIVIFMLILVMFGPRRLPEIAKTIGKVIHDLRRASEDFKDQVMSIETEIETVDSEASVSAEDVSRPEEDPYDDEPNDMHVAPIDMADEESTHFEEDPYGDDLENMAPVDLPEDENREAQHDRAE